MQQYASLLQQRSFSKTLVLVFVWDLSEVKEELEHWSFNSGRVRPIMYRWKAALLENNHAPTSRQPLSFLWDLPEFFSLARENMVTGPRVVKLTQVNIWLCSPVTGAVSFYLYYTSAYLLKRKTQVASLHRMWHRFKHCAVLTVLPKFKPCERNLESIFNKHIKRSQSLIFTGNYY